MSVQMVFPNLPVREIGRATDFYVALGFEKNDMFSDATTSCVVVNDVVAVMLLEVDRFQGFLPEGRTAHLGGGATEMTNALLLDSDEEVDDLVRRAATSGGSVTRDPEAADGMYGAAFADPDGHLWEVFHMAPPEGA